MNFNSVRSAVSSPSILRNVVIIIVALIVAYVIYYFATRGVFGGSNSSRANMIPVTSLINANDPSSCVVATTLSLSPWTTGGEYTLTGWFYISDWTVNAGSYRQLFSLQSGSNTLLYAVIDAESPTLIIRVLGQGDLQQGAGAASSLRPDLVGNGFTTLMTTQNQMLGSTNPLGPIGVAPCDVGDINLQRWIFVSLVIRGRVVDVYLDGKLARECVLPSLPAVTPGSLTLNVGSTPVSGGAGAAIPSFGGYISNVQTFSTAQSPDSIISLYQAGPQAPTGGWLSSLLQVFNVTITFSNSNGSNSYTLKL